MIAPCRSSFEGFQIFVLYSQPNPSSVECELYSMDSGIHFGWMDSLHQAMANLYIHRHIYIHKSKFFHRRSHVVTHSHTYAPIRAHIQAPLYYRRKG